ncbi:hypothetical protein LP416_25465 [Polaromonas sp. P2-4]|nr:hypothetical protein LP416_25465 [Polaromonas sp. P2-4]
MLDGMDVLEAGDSLLDDFEDSVDFGDSQLETTDLPNASVAQQRLQLVRRELFEIRDLLSTTQ